LSKIKKPNRGGLAGRGNTVKRRTRFVGEGGPCAGERDFDMRLGTLPVNSFAGKSKGENQYKKGCELGKKGRLGGGEDNVIGKACKMLKGHWFWEVLF